MQELIKAWTSAEFPTETHTYVSNIFFSFSVRFGKQAVHTDRVKLSSE